MEEQLNPPASLSSSYLLFLEVIQPDAEDI